MARNTFKASYFGTPVYECRICQRRTRDTGDNGSVELCPECNEWSMEENGISDNALQGNELAAAEAFIVNKKQEAVNKGGSIKGFVKK